MKVGYIRISSVSQRPKTQREALEKAGCVKIYADITTGDEECPEMTRMLGHLKQGDTVVVWRIDRLGPDTKRQLQFALNFEARGIGFISLEDEIDTTTEDGSLSFKSNLRWALNYNLPPNTAIIYLWLKDYGHIKIENCKTGIASLDKIAEQFIDRTGCIYEEGYPGFDIATFFIDAFGGEIERIEYGPVSHHKTDALEIPPQPDTESLN